jgi:copper chaperone
MRTYKVTGMTCGDCEIAFSRAIRHRLGDDTAADAGKGEVLISESADPQIVVFAIDSAS